MEWREIPGIDPCYEVSDEGHVRSCALYRGSCEWRMLAFWTLPHGYQTVMIAKNKRFVRQLVHRLVAKAFIPNPGNLAEVNHRDCDKKNNHATNLEWCSKTQNNRHAMENGRIGIGERGSTAKLSDAQVQEIRTLVFERGIPQRKVAFMFSVSPALVCLIANGYRSGNAHVKYTECRRGDGPKWDHRKIVT